MQKTYVLECCELAVGFESQHVKFPSKCGDLENTQKKRLEDFAEIFESFVKLIVIYLYIVRSREGNSPCRGRLSTTESKGSPPPLLDLQPILLSRHSIDCCEDHMHWHCVSYICRQCMSLRQAARCRKERASRIVTSASEEPAPHSSTRSKNRVIKLL